MAAPMVTGAAAMVWSHFEGIRAAEVKEILWLHDHDRQVASFQLTIQLLCALVVPVEVS